MINDNSARVIQQVFYIIDPESLASLRNSTDVKNATANPAALGLLGFGLTTVLLNIANTGAYPLNSMILGMGIFYGGIA